MSYHEHLTDITSSRRFVIGVVDDDTRVLESLEELLTAGGHDVLLFSSAGGFLSADGLNRIDCLISDVFMPEMSGWELLQIARTEHPDVPVIFITAHSEEDAEAFLAGKGVRYLFRKPFDGDELLRALDEIFRPGATPLNR